jgi:hypothetical protein
VVGTDGRGSLAFTFTWDDVVNLRLSTKARLVPSRRSTSLV